MNSVRRATPDSEAVASSEDERPWPSSTSFGKLPMKENNMPVLPGGIWSNQQKRGSFKMAEAAQRNAAREARLGAPNHAHSALRAGSTPSPSVSEGNGPGMGSLPFAIPLQPTPKTGRSLSHSQGQREFPQSPEHHTSTTASQSIGLSLGLVQEELDTESDSELGGKLTQTTSHPPIGSLMRMATFPARYELAHSSDRDRVDEYEASTGPKYDRKIDAAFANLSIDSHHRPQWQSSLGWDDVPNINESRRHSLADIPTRRGSLVGGESGFFGRTLSRDAFENEDSGNIFPSRYQGFAGQDRSSDSDNTMSHGKTASETFNIPTMYRVPYVELKDHERSELESRREQQATASAGSPWSPNRPRKQLYIVSFKCSRVDVFYLLENTGLHVREGDLVIVEADRGQDLGTVQHAKVTPDLARLLKKKYSEEQYKWLMMYSRNKDGGYNPNAQMNGDHSASSSNAVFPDAPSNMQGIPRDSFNNLKPKAIKRLANEREIRMLAEKEGNEAKAKRTCQQKVAHLRLQMEILDAEWQWDFQKLIFYYYADHYINFKDLITELYRIYKTRIWLSAINPASFSQHAMSQPPSGIGPGAVTPFNPYAVNSAYTMNYGEDRDPYGAQMPYRIGYETYNPNYPAIPGVTNSFAPQPGNANPYVYSYPNAFPPEANAPLQAHEANDDTTPTADTGTIPVNNMYGYTFYERSGANGQGAHQYQHPGSTERSQHGERVGQPQQGNQSGPWNTMPHNAPNAAGLGRQSVLPMPIGTRPTPNGPDISMSLRPIASMDSNSGHIRGSFAAVRQDSQVNARKDYFQQ